MYRDIKHYTDTIGRHSTEHRVQYRHLCVTAGFHNSQYVAKAKSTILFYLREMNKQPQCTLTTREFSTSI